MSIGNHLEELALFFILRLGHLGTLSLLSVKLLTSLSVLLVLQLDDGEWLLTILNLSFDLWVVQKPLGQEVHWLLRLLLVHNSHALSDDLAELFALYIFCVWELIDHLEMNYRRRQLSNLKSLPPFDWQKLESSYGVLGFWGKTKAEAENNKAATQILT